LVTSFLEGVILRKFHSIGLDYHATRAPVTAATGLASTIWFGFVLELLTPLLGSIGSGDVTEILDGGRRHRPNRREVVATPFPGGGNISSASMAGIEIEKNALQSCPVPARQAQRGPGDVAPVEMTKDLCCPLLGIFGNDDRAPSPVGDVITLRCRRTKVSWNGHFS
jgi:hypothetical protein